MSNPLENDEYLNNDTNNDNSDDDDVDSDVSNENASASIVSSHDDFDEDSGSEISASDDDEDDDEEDDDDDDDDEEDDDESQLSDDDSNAFIDPYDEDMLPEYACRYCGVHDPASVAKCVETSKWFCNAPCAGGGGSHLVNHLVRSRSHRVQLHPDSPLGDNVLECYNCGNRNVFVLGFVPATASSVVVLLCRVCVETVPALKDMDWELSQWHPLIQDRKFLPWLVTVPSDKLLLRARDLTQAQINKLEELWKTEPDACFADLDRPDVVDEEELAPALLHYEDGYHYQNVLAPLVKMEADYDRQMKESLSAESISVRWEKSLAGKNVATFSFGSRYSADQSKIMVGDELRLKLGDGAQFYHGREWEGTGYVKGIYDGEIEIEMKGGDVPDKITDDFLVEYIWKSTSFDRMQNALKTFAIDDTSVTGYIFHSLLGHPVEEQKIATARVPASDEEFAVPGLPPLNESQMEAVAAVIQRPLSLIQVR